MTSFPRPSQRFSRDCLHPHCSRTDTRLNAPITFFYFSSLRKEKIYHENNMTTHFFFFSFFFVCVYICVWLFYFLRHFLCMNIRHRYPSYLLFLSALSLSSLVPWCNCYLSYLHQHNIDDVVFLLPSSEYDLFIFVMSIQLLFFVVVFFFFFFFVCVCVFDHYEVQTWTV